MCTTHPADNATCQRAPVAISEDLPSCCPSASTPLNMDVSSEHTCQELSPRPSLSLAPDSSGAMTCMFNMHAAHPFESIQFESAQPPLWPNSADGSLTEINTCSRESSVHGGNSLPSEAPRAFPYSHGSDPLLHSTLSCESLAAWDDEPALLFNNAADELLNIHCF
jgi:hypothetical protein